MHLISKLAKFKIRPNSWLIVRELVLFAKVWNACPIKKGEFGRTRPILAVLEQIGWMQCIFRWRNLHLSRGACVYYEFLNRNGRYISWFGQPLKNPVGCYTLKFETIPYMVQPRIIWSQFSKKTDSFLQLMVIPEFNYYNVSMERKVHRFRSERI
jgi:hypothetical protein